MKVKFFTKYTRAGASSRLRTFQYLNFLESQGIQFTVFPFFGDEYLSQVYLYKRHNKWLAFKAFVSRFWHLWRLEKGDRVVIEKELFPYFPAFFEWTLYVRGIRYVVDYDDAIFHNYDVSSNPLIRLVLGKKIESVVRFSSLVVAGNDYLKEKALSFGARKVVLVPTVIDLEKYSLKEERRSVFTIGWIGSPITHKYLHSLKGVFERLASRYQFKVVYVGANTTLGLSVEEVVPWNEVDEVEQIKRFDVGIMPLEDNIWERGKCGYKLIQYMGCGIPVVGTPLGVNKRLIVHGYNGYQASTPADWEQYLELLILNRPEENRTMGLNGRRLVEESFSLQVHQSKWLKILNTYAA